MKENGGGGESCTVGEGGGATWNLEQDPGGVRRRRGPEGDNKRAPLSPLSSSQGAGLPEWRQTLNCLLALEERWSLEVEGAHLYLVLGRDSNTLRAVEISNLAAKPFQKISVHAGILGTKYIYLTFVESDRKISKGDRRTPEVP